MTPRCRLTFTDTKDLAERQAARLRQLLAVQARLHETDLAGLPRLQIVREQLPTSGLSYWNGQTWIVALNADDSPARQLYTLCHEYKHIIDHGAARQLYRSQWEAERAADYFAACLLMPKPDLKRVFCNLTQDLRWLARYFGVSQSALRYRLEQTGLVDPPIFTRERCARPVSTPSWQDQRFKPVPMNRSHA
jgi:Zn-dependent peptidase ImmA (M78 family)